MQKRRLVLVVENDEADGLCIEQAFSRHSEAQCVRLRTAEDALSHLGIDAQPGSTAPRALPDLILLDLVLPGSSGTELLRRLRQNEMTKHIPVVALTSSRKTTDREAAYQWGVTSYLLKPARAVDLSRMIDAVVNYWSFCEIPESPAALTGPLRR